MTLSSLCLLMVSLQFQTVLQGVEQAGEGTFSGSSEQNY